MRRVLELLLPAMALVAMLTAGAGSASAQFEISDEGTEQHCSAVEMVTLYTVSGGCSVEFESTGEVPLFVDVPGVGPTQIANCEYHLEARIGEDGEGVVTSAVLTSHPEPSFPCTRTPCDTVAPAHLELLWPIRLVESAGEETLEMTFCVRPTAAAEGSSNVACAVDLEIDDLGGHQHEIGHPGGVEVHCQRSIFPVAIWIENAHFVTEGGSDSVEIVH